MSTTSDRNDPRLTHGVDEQPVDQAPVDWREQLLRVVTELRSPDPRVLMTDGELTDALLPVAARLRAEAAAEALDAAFREDKTTVAKLGPVERLTCYLVKAEDLVARAAALRAEAQQ